MTILSYVLFLQIFAFIAMARVILPNTDIAMSG
jgi:hypothetical protein